MYSPREFAAYIILVSFLIFFLSYGVIDSVQHPQSTLASSVSGILGSGRTPDFSRYVPLDTLSSDTFPLDDPTRRVILVGDIHGMIKPFHKLLKAISYNADADTLIHVGDIVAKGPHKSSMAVVSYMVKHNIIGVRGNHDQKIIEWRGWINWICASSKGCQWLERLERQWNAQNTSSVHLNSFVDTQRKTPLPQDQRWWKRVPEGWELLGDHYKIAKELSNKEFEYFLGLPLRLYIPSAHAYVVHAGLLPSDPHYHYYDKGRQPLATVPKIHRKIPKLELVDNPEAQGGKKVLEQLRNLQEIALLTQIPQNANPWVVLNMRSIKDGKVSRKTDGKPWSKRWKKEMNKCVGFNGKLDLGSTNDTDALKGKHELPCYPSTVIYGHAAARGLDVKRWTFGLDSGCVYGRRLSAIVLGGPRLNINEDTDNGLEDADEGEVKEEDEDEESVDGADADNEDNEARKIEVKEEQIRKPKNGAILPFGDNSKAQLISVKCKKF